MVISSRRQKKYYKTKEQKYLLTSYVLLMFLMHEQIRGKADETSPRQFSFDGSD